MHEGSKVQSSLACLSLSLMGLKNREKTERENKREKFSVSGLRQIYNQEIALAISQTKLLETVIHNIGNPLRSQIVQQEDTVPPSATSSPMVCSHLPGLVFTCTVKPSTWQLTLCFCNVNSNGALIFTLPTAKYSLN